MQENKEAMEFFLSLVDEVDRSLSGDYLAEELKKKEYIISFPFEEEKKALLKELDEIPPLRDCHRCPLWEGKLEIPPLNLKPKAKVLFILPYPTSSKALLDGEEAVMFSRQVAALGLKEEDYVLTSLMKCATDHLDQEQAALCRCYLRQQMENVNLKCFVLLGREVSSYMLRKDVSLLRTKIWNVNGKPCISTYSQKECLENPALKRDVWTDLKKMISFL